MTHEFHDDARAEAIEDARWYGRRSASAAVGFIRELQAAVDAIGRDPERYQPIGGGARVFRLKRYPYHVVYVVHDGTVFVVAVACTRREPGYWRHRLE